MYKLTYKIAAMTDVGLVRTNNEDNLCVISNLDQNGSTWKNNEVCNLGTRGALLVVADGMGGMNAGEVASEIAVSVVKARFTDDIDRVDLNSDESIVKFMNDSIVIADNTIKSEGKHRPEAKGMGTTIVIAWLLAGKLYVSWCGDSRAYLYNPHRGLVQISKDHSYVQDLVDKGIVKPEDAFDFPESNVITRCLSHSSMKAVPDNLSSPYIVGEGDIILLCTDGLCGMIRDNEIADVMAAHTTDMSECVECLIEAAKVAAGADNVTVCLCQIMGTTSELGRTNTPLSPAAKTPTPQTEIPKPTNHNSSNIRENRTYDKNKKNENRRRSITAALITLAIAIIALFLMIELPRLHREKKGGGTEGTIEVNDSANKGNKAITEEKEYPKQTTTEEDKNTQKAETPNSREEKVKVFRGDNRKDSSGENKKNEAKKLPPILGSSQPKNQNEDFDATEKKRIRDSIIESNQEKPN